MTTQNFQIGQQINYNDGRSGHNANAIVEEVWNTGMKVQFEDRMSTTTIMFSDLAWMNFITIVKA